MLFGPGAAIVSNCSVDFSSEDIDSLDEALSTINGGKALIIASSFAGTV